MDDHVEHQEPVKKKPGRQRKDGGLGDVVVGERHPPAAWVFDRDIATTAMNEAQVAATRLVECEVEGATMSREYAKAVYGFVVSFTSPAQLVAMKSQTAVEAFPAEVIEFLDDHDIPEPHPNSHNPFLGIYQHFYNQDRRRLSEVQLAELGTTGKQVVTLIERAESGEAAKKARQAAYTHTSRWAMVVAAALEQTDDKGTVIGEKLIDQNPKTTVDGYSKWRKDQATAGVSTLALPPPATTRRKKKVEADDQQPDTSNEMAPPLASDPAEVAAAIARIAAAAVVAPAPDLIVGVAPDAAAAEWKPIRSRALPSDLPPHGMLCSNTRRTASARSSGLPSSAWAMLLRPATARPQRQLLESAAASSSGSDDGEACPACAPEVASEEEVNQRWLGGGEKPPRREAA